MLQSLLVSLLIGLGAVSGYEIKIFDMDEFIDFVDSVNGGVLYRGVTIALETDLDFSGGLSQKFEPIGKNSTHYFPGTFDGQGHVISNLAINSSSDYTGLFGYSTGLTARNIVIDASCSVKSTIHSERGAVGGVIGQCYSDTRNCTLENNVNMASVTFCGHPDDRGNYVYLGGIGGYVYARSQYSSIKNCANYGPVVNSGTGYEAYIAGIAGRSYYADVQNCLNYGDIQHEWDTTKDLTIGGIVGYGTYTTFENCVNAGTIKASASGYKYIGNIIGYGTYTISLSHCYWNEETQFGVYGYVDMVETTECTSFNRDFVLNETVSVEKYTGKSLPDALNANSDRYRLREYSRWLTNKDENAVSFTVNDKKTITMNSQLILLPNIANGGNMLFDGWYTDKECTVPLKNFEISGPTDLYAKFGENANTYTITFDTRGGPPIDPIKAKYHDVVELPRNVSKKGFAFVYWEDEVGDEAFWEFFMPSYDVTLYAVWAPIHISTAEDLVEFSRIVNTGKIDYTGSTVYLDSDIEFTPELSEQFEPIGRSDVIYENGNPSVLILCNLTFDGQGHAIKDLTINASSSYPSMYAGLFGYASGAIIKNVVMDKSCTMVTSHMKRIIYDGPYVGGIIGFCSSKRGPCIVENCVNRMDIIHTGYVYTLYLGGIAGFFIPFDHVSTIKYCANYGTVELGDKSLYYTAYIGGILGEGLSNFMTGEPVRVRHSTNYGLVKFTGEIKGSLYIDCIVGYSYYTEVWDSTCSGEVIDSVVITNSHVAGAIVLFVIMVVITIALIVLLYSLIK